MAAPHPRSPTVDLLLPDEAATAALARRVAARARAGDVIALSGDLGTGKTAFARAFITALAHPAGAADEVPSPTFTLVQGYEREPAPVWHFDLYRLTRPEEVYELGFEEALCDGISLIEWPERLGRLLPAERLDVHLAYGASETARQATVTGAGSWLARLCGIAGDE